MAGGLSPETKAYTSKLLLDHPNIMSFYIYSRKSTAVYALCVCPVHEKALFYILLS
jgi:hypothetical protein